MRSDILAAQPQDPTLVAEWLVTARPQGKPHFYQKHMTQHMLRTVPRSWMADVVNVFLIRHPARVVASYAAKRQNPTFDDIGFRQQAELFEYARLLGQDPIVIDSGDIRRDPERMLRLLCRAIGLEFEPGMLHWPAGGKPQDGVWAAHWYGAVHRSTGFAEAEGPLPELRGHLADLAEQALVYFESLASHRLGQRA